MVRLHRDFSARGLEILAFPCNQFGNQEPKEARLVKEFAKSRYGVKFHIMDKVDVTGPGAHDVFRFLKTAAPQATISWNFGVYYVVSKDGEVRAFQDVTPASLTDVIRDDL
mmetsp:Transcript_24274/g.72843  ORF Transcript_24274/g.72843 Transcript_24274/m.72843 type:complete len:111 (-) Transcript_24274:119-451(-)